MSNSSLPHGLQPTRLLRPWDFPGKRTGVGCHCLLCSELMEVGNLTQSSRSSAQIQLAPNLSVSDLPQALAVPRACGCQGTLIEPLGWGPTCLLPPQAPPLHSRRASCILQLLSFLFLFFLPSSSIQADQESQPTSRSQSEARWLCPFLQPQQAGSLGSSPGLSTKEGHQGSLGTG